MAATLAALGDRLIAKKDVRLHRRRWSSRYARNRRRPTFLDPANPLRGARNHLPGLGDG
jgi:hypothetical protein